MFACVQTQRERADWRSKVRAYSLANSVLQQGPGSKSVRCSIFLAPCARMSLSIDRPGVGLGAQITH